MAVSETQVVSVIAAEYPIEAVLARVEASAIELVSARVEILAIVVWEARIALATAALVVAHQAEERLEASAAAIQRAAAVAARPV